MLIATARRLTRLGSTASRSASGVKISIRRKTTSDVSARSGTGQAGVRLGGRMTRDARARRARQDSNRTGPGETHEVKMQSGDHDVTVTTNSRSGMKGAHDDDG